METFDFFEDQAPEKVQDWRELVARAKNILDEMTRVSKELSGSSKRKRGEEERDGENANKRSDNQSSTEKQKKKPPSFADKAKAGRKKKTPFHKRFPWGIRVWKGSDKNPLTRSEWSLVEEELEFLMFMRMKDLKVGERMCEFLGYSLAGCGLVAASCEMSCLWFMDALESLDFGFTVRGWGAENEHDCWTLMMRPAPGPKVTTSLFVEGITSANDIPGSCEFVDDFTVTDKDNARFVVIRPDKSMIASLKLKANKKLRVNRGTAVFEHRRARQGKSSNHGKIINIVDESNDDPEGKADMDESPSASANAKEGGSGPKPEEKTESQKVSSDVQSAKEGSNLSSSQDGAGSSSSMQPKMRQQTMKEALEVGRESRKKECHLLG